MKLEIEDGLIDGHEACASFLGNKVKELLSIPANLNKEAQEILLNEISKVFNEDDNKILEKGTLQRENSCEP